MLYLLSTRFWVFRIRASRTGARLYVPWHIVVGMISSLYYG